MSLFKLKIVLATLAILASLPAAAQSTDVCGFQYFTTAEITGEYEWGSQPALISSVDNPSMRANTIFGGSNTLGPATITRQGEHLLLEWDILDATLSVDNRTTVDWNFPRRSKDIVTFDDAALVAGCSNVSNMTRFYGPGTFKGTKEMDVDVYLAVYLADDERIVSLVGHLVLYMEDAGDFENARIDVPFKLTR